MPFPRRRFGRSLVLLAASALLLVGGTAAQAQLTPDQMADMLLAGARRAYTEKNYPFAVQRFREFLAKYGGHKEANAARYGLALALLDGPERDYQAALEPLQPLAANKDFPEQPQAQYYLGLAHRGLGLRELAHAVGKPAELPQRRANANGRFDEAAKQFTAAIASFAARVKTPPAADAKELPLDLEWSARARCDLAEVLLRTLKTKEALAAAEPFVKDASLAKSRFRSQGLYHYGFASFLLGDRPGAAKTLGQLAPFDQPAFGLHARYLLGRVHQAEGERAEAAVHYDAVVADHVKQKQQATELLRQPERFRNDPDEKARLEALVRDPQPDHVTRAQFHHGVLLYEDGRFADALARFAAFVQLLPQSPYVPEATLRIGFCHVQLRQYAEALKILQPLADKEPKLADQALLWIGKSQLGAADPNNVAAYDAAVKVAADTFRRAADRAAALGNADPDAKARRAEALLEAADAQALVKQFREAAATYLQVAGEKALPQREEELQLRHLTALHLAGDHAASDQACQRFVQAYPKSPLLPSVLFRHAENAAFLALAAEKTANPATRQQELAKHNDEVIKRYQAVVEKFPEFPQVAVARFGMGQAYYRKGDLEKAKEILEAIPVGERAGELAAVPYVLADCLIRLAPVKADDALAAGRLEEQLKAAVDLLDSFANAQPQGPQTPDALLKLGHCHQRLASLLAQPPERAKPLGSARAAYERLLQQFPKHDLVPNAVFERAKCLAAAGDPNGAINELRRFTADPLKVAPVAPLGVLSLATLLRGQNKAQEAADVLAACRQAHEPKLAGDPTRAAWVPLLQYHHGVALREAGKRKEARDLLDQVVRQSPTRPEAAEAALRWGQSLRDDGMGKVGEARRKLASSPKPEETVVANKLLADGLKEVQDAATYLEAQAAALQQRQAGPEARARMHYEAAWCWRTLAEAEVEAALEKVVQQKWQKLKDDAAKKAAAAGLPAPTVPRPEAALKEVPLQNAEQKARGQYQAVLSNTPDVPLTGESRFELAELNAERGEHDAALKLLREGLDKEPSAELTDKIRIRLGACLFANGDADGAMKQFQAVANNPKSQLVGQAHYRAGECLMQQSKWDEAAKRLAVFRDQGPFQNLPGVTDKALLRLGHAYAQLKQWEPSRQAHEQAAGRYPNGPWVHEARYGMGWAHQNLKQFDQAVGAYGQVTAGTATEIGAKAQLQIGICRLEQKRYAEATTALLVVPFTYDYPDLSATALSEAARAFVEQKQPQQAEKLLRRVIKDHPDSEQAKAAKERLEALTKG